MNNLQDLFIARDIVPVFDYTINEDAKAALLKIFTTPLGSIADIAERQHILKALLADEDLAVAHQYRKVDYVDVQRFLIYFSQDELMKIDYLTYLFQQQKNNVLYGHYSQLIYFFNNLEDTIKDHINLASLPKGYQQEIRFLLNYLNDFKLSTLKVDISKQKFGYASVQMLNKLVLEKRNNGDTLLFFSKLSLLESYIAICKGITKMKFNFVAVGTTDFALSGMYHPLVAEAVKNSIGVKGHVILITGANMSGKSTLLKTIGLCVYLAHIGLPIPAQEGHIPFYEHISIHINHSDDLKNGYSHFMNEIMHLKNVVLEAKKGKKCFTIFDELFKGTNPEDALVISKAAILGLQKITNSLFFISTHLGDLKEEIMQAQIPTYYIDCVIDEGIPRFSYQLKSGWSDLKIGQLLFKKVGLGDLLSDTN